MIELITGLPGNAKTLRVLELVIERAHRENRAVYYSGLKEFISDDPRLKGTSWAEFDPLTWHEKIPSGAIMLIDEAQKTFRARSLGSIPPKFVTELEEHRHKGLDFYMITQHPSFVDAAVRKLTQTHHHMVRIWGMEASTIHKWNGVKDNCDKSSARNDSEKTKWGFNKALYGLYKSADAHTMKRSIPMRAKLLLLVPVLLAAAAWFVYSKVVKQPGQSGTVNSTAVEAMPGSAANPLVSPAALAHSANIGKQPFDEVADAKVYIQQQTERIAGLPHTAPKYDQITVPVRAPVPAACIQRGQVSDPEPVTCKCFTQQGTPMQVEYNMCIEFARNGWFRDFDPEQDRKNMDRTAEGVRVLASRPDYSPTGEGRVVVIPHIQDPRIAGTSMKN